MMVSSSLNRTGQMKIICWVIFFIQQVETSMNLNLSLEVLRNNLMNDIEEIRNDLKYDIKNHKEEEISQLKVFIDYIDDKLGNYPQPEEFLWQSTIKLYENFQSIRIKH